MSDKRFKIYQDSIRKFESDRIWGVKSETNSLEPYMTFKEAEKCCDLLNEQQELIEELHISDHMGWGRAEKFEKELKQKKIYIKRLEYKVQKFKEMNYEQQDKITELEKNFDDLVKWASEIAKRNVLLDERIGRLQQAIRIVYEKKPYPTFEDIQNEINNDI